MAGFIVVAETALILLAVLTDVSGFMKFMTGDVGERLGAWMNQALNSANCLSHPIPSMMEV